MVQSKHDMIAQDIASKIKYHQYKEGDYLPSEHQLCELYGTSRETIRKALNHLTELGLIQKIRGKGSVVLDIQKFTFPISGITSFKELNRSLNMHAKTTVLKQVNTLAPKKFMDINIDNQQAIFVERLRTIDDLPVVLDQDYLLTPPASSLPAGVAEDSIYEYLEKELHLEVSYATKAITVEKAADDIAEKLQLDDDKLVVIVRSLSYLDDTTLFQLTSSYHRPDKFKFIDFARRKKI